MNLLYLHCFMLAIRAAVGFPLIHMQNVGVTCSGGRAWGGWYILSDGLSCMEANLLGKLWGESKQSWEEQRYCLLVGGASIMFLQH